MAANFSAFLGSTGHEGFSTSVDPTTLGTPRSLAIHAFCPQAITLGQKLAHDIGGDLFAPARLVNAYESLVRTATIRTFSRLPDHMAACFHYYAAHVFIGATGIAVRAIAPHLRGKTTDPAVVVCEIHGESVISLLSGHVGGANALARYIAELTGGRAVITTATDSEGLPALDIMADVALCRVGDPQALKLVTSVLLAGSKPALIDPLSILDISDADRARLFEECDSPPPSLHGEMAPAVVVGFREVSATPGRLRLYARRLHVGLGYRKGVAVDELEAALLELLHVEGLAKESVASVATADLKMEDPALRELARRLDATVHYYSSKMLEQIPVPNPSAKAAALFGSGPLGVSEGSALLSAGSGSQLLVPKQVLGNVTIAVALPLPAMPQILGNMALEELNDIND